MLMNADSRTPMWALGPGPADIRTVSLARVKPPAAVNRGRHFDVGQGMRPTRRPRPGWAAARTMPEGVCEPTIEAPCRAAFAALLRKPHSGCGIGGDQGRAGGDQGRTDLRRASVRPREVGVPPGRVDGYGTAGEAWRT
ncbi:hypothetical protein GCM10010365_56530 [Streptomyces poonensis]|uniref:Uncharacterized protein n=1 Tax=Streptomyces poonensis TaxID=68255 RepID=A0A918Q008_9ACTN|nr:hypothetical protein GCM10010365_56530 [Streptomyces poonensis]